MNTSSINFDALNEIEAATSAIGAFNYLVTAAIERGDDFSFVAGGVHLLLDSQYKLLATAQATVRGQFAQLKSAAEAIPTMREKVAEPASPLPGADYYGQTQALIARFMVEGRSVEEIAVMTALDATRVRIFVECMPEHMKEVAQQQHRDPRTLRAAFISEKINEGYDASEIANALNLKKATVERVVAQLMGLGNIANDPIRRAAGE